MLRRAFQDQFASIHRAPSVSGADHRSSYRASWTVIAFGSAIALLTLSLSGMGIALESVAPLVCFIAMFAAGELLYTRYRPDARIASACGMLAILPMATLTGAIISHAGLKFDFAYIDSALSTADLMLGIHAPAIVLAFAKYPNWVSALELIYNTTLLVCVVCGLALAACGRTSRARELAFVFTFCLLIACVVSIFLPALGSTVYHGIEGVAGLPSQAGNFHMATVAYYRDDPSAIFDLTRTQGIVTFPSFHLVMAMMIPHALRGAGIVTWLSVGWGLLVAVSSVVIGGHYIVDLLGGAVCWAVAVWLIRTRSSTIRTQAKPHFDKALMGAAP